MAGPAVATTGGDNGDVKIHSKDTEDSDQRNDPKVCEFYVVGFNFDPGQTIEWWIQAGPPFGAEEPPGVKAGALTADENGFAKSELIQLDDGHYKLWWRFEGENGWAKFKVFKVDCGEPNPEPIPGVAAAEMCPTDESAESGVEVTLTNSGNGNATFTVDGETVVVAPGGEETVLVAVGEDESYDITVTEETTAMTWGFQGTLNCDEPEPEPQPGPGAGFTESCVDGGIIVFLDNVGDAEANFVVEATVNGEPVDTINETVAPDDAVEFVLELESGDAYEIVVTEESTSFLAFTEGTFLCLDEEPEPSPEPSDEGSPTPAPSDRGGALPKTGSDFPTATAAWLAVFLLATGGFLLTWRRGMLRTLPALYRRKH